MKEERETVTRENCGRVLKELRQKFGSMSVAELSKTLGVARSTIMRIESGRTSPSDDLLNRLKAIQIIGISKYRTIAQTNTDRFSRVIEEIGENPDLFSELAFEQMAQRLTPAGILAGIGAIASSSLSLTSTLVSSIPVLSSLGGYGLIKGLKSVLRANQLQCVEKEDTWEIVHQSTNANNETKIEKEGRKMDAGRGNEEKKSAGSFDFGLGGLLSGLGNLINAATNMAEKGEEFSKSGEIDFSSLDKIKGLKDLKGVYGVRVRTMADGKPSVQPFGNIKRTPKGPVVEEVREPIIDVFDEPEGIHVVAEMPGIDEKDLHIEIKGDILNIGAEGRNRKYRKEVLLSREATAEQMNWSYKNGILEIKIVKSEK